MASVAINRHVLFLFFVSSILPNLVCFFFFIPGQVFFGRCVHKNSIFMVYKVLSDRELGEWHQKPAGSHP